MLLPGTSSCSIYLRFESSPYIHSPSIRMMLRSSSTPILGSLLSSYSESPSHGNQCEYNSPKHLPKKFSFHQTHTCPLNLITPSSYSNSSPSINAELTFDCSHSSRLNGFRRVQSDGNLEGLASASCNSFDDLNHSIPSKKFPRKPNCPVLQSIPSFSVYNPKIGYEDDDDVEEEKQEEAEESGEEVEEETSGKLSLENSFAIIKNMGSQERYVNNQDGSEDIPSKMHLARGLGMITGGYNNGGGGNGGYNEYKAIGFGDVGSDGASMAEHYKKMVEDNPGNTLLLRNYAEFLYKSKDLRGAEEYYSRAILVDPGDGEILSLYAQLTMELHGDEERALSYFQRAVQASPENSHVLAAYAGFLWDTEEEDGHLRIIPPIHHTAPAAASF